MHLAQCPDCAAAYDALQAAQDAYAALGDEEDVPPACAAAWRQAVRQDADASRVIPLRAKRAQRLQRWTTWAGVAAAALFLVVGTSAMRSNGWNLAQEEKADSTLRASQNTAYEVSAKDEGFYALSADAAPMLAAGNSLGRGNAPAPQAEPEPVAEAPRAVPRDASMAGDADQAEQDAAPFALAALPEAFTLGAQRDAQADASYAESEATDDDSASVWIDGGEAPAPAPALSAIPEEPEAPAPVAPRAVQLLRSAWFTLRTDAFDDGLARVQALLAQAGGWQEQRNTYGEPFTVEAGTGRTASLTLRVPTDRLDAFLTDLRAVGQVTRSGEQAQDISEQYYDTQGRLAIALAHRARLQELMAVSGTIADLVTLEQALSDVQYEIDSLSGTLQGWDSRIAYAVVTVTLTEDAPAGLLPVASQSLGARLTRGFYASVNATVAFLGDMLVFVVWCLPWLGPLAALGVLVWALRRARRKRRQRP